MELPLDENGNTACHWLTMESLSLAVVELPVSVGEFVGNESLEPL
jgi:hypothetical protein